MTFFVVQTGNPKFLKFAERLYVTHAPRRAASTLVSPPGECFQWCRDESRHGTHECVRHINAMREHADPTSSAPPALSTDSPSAGQTCR
jgi:hypothetical protein